MKAVVNSSPLIFLVKIGKLDLLNKLFDEVIIPKAVYEEAVLSGKPDKNEIIKNLSWIKVEEVKDKRLVKFLMNFIDYGESEVIAYAVENNIDLVILDDKDARKIARELDLKVIGTLGILIISKKKGYINEIKPLLEKLITNNFRVSEKLLKKILEEVGEKY
jgi:predicted nucleic acid-binding protein